SWLRGGQRKRGFRWISRVGRIEVTLADHLVVAVILFPREFEGFASQRDVHIDPGLPGSSIATGVVVPQRVDRHPRPKRSVALINAEGLPGNLFGVVVGKVKVQGLCECDPSVR